MTALAWVFMLTSVGFVTGLMIWCFRRVLGRQDDEQGGRD